jgi:hypothetical protein
LRTYIGSITVDRVVIKYQDRRSAMALSRGMLLAVAGAAAIGGASTLAIAQWSPYQNSPLMRGFADAWSSSTTPSVVGQLASNDGIYVDMKDFKIAKGTAKDSALVQEQIAKLGAREVKDGAIIFRAGDKLYLVDRHPSAPTQ